MKTPRRCRVSHLSGILSIIAIGSVLLAAGIEAQSTPRLRRQGQIVVRERAGLSASALQRTLRRHGATAARIVPGIGATVVELPEEELHHAERALRRSGLFKSVERDYLARIAEVPNDPYYSAQWGLPRIAAPQAWTITTGSPDVVVAVLDTGVDFDHQDLAGQLVPGHDFINDDDDPHDDNGHGTRMAGIVAAIRGNGEGVVGVAPGAAILAVKVLDQNGFGPYSDVASGIAYAVDQGARVINLSLVGTAPSSVLQSAIDYATANGVVTVAASGNFGTSDPVYPAANTGVVTVGAIDESDARPSFSNYGAWINLAAPGVNIVTTTLGGVYASSTGTSPATAFGSGVFALRLAYEPTLTREQAIAAIEGGATDLGSSGWDPSYGWGLVDAYAALTGQPGNPPADEAKPTVTLLSPAHGSLGWGFIPVDVAANDDVAISRVELFVDKRRHATAVTPPYSFVLDTTQFNPGKHKVRAYAYDTSGRSAKTKNLKVYFTPGTGLLVKRAVAKTDSARITALFALPGGTVFDPSLDDLSVTLTSATGTVFSATVEAGELESSRSGKATATVAPSVPTEGSVRLITQGRGNPLLYTLKVKATKLAGMGQMDTVMDLTVQVGDTVLSQSLTFRSRGARLVYP